MFAQQSASKLGEARGRVVEHREDRDPVGDRERNLDLPRDQGALDGVRLVREVGAALPRDQLKGAVVGEVESGETHQSTRCKTRSNSDSGFLSPRAP